MQSRIVYGNKLQTVGFHLVCDGWINERTDGQSNTNYDFKQYTFFFKKRKLFIYFYSCTWYKHCKKDETCITFQQWKIFPGNRVLYNKSFVWKYSSELNSTCLCRIHFVLSTCLGHIHSTVHPHNIKVLLYSSLSFQVVYYLFTVLIFSSKNNATDTFRSENWLIHHSLFILFL